MNASGKKVAFLVDFDNVATDVIEQALNAVFKDYGAAHIRRAYCNAEQALREQHFLKRLGLRAIVNLAIGKNSTDIALAADAMDLAIAEKPDVIVLVSSDSDFAPLVLRLREKGAWLRGFGQYGKTGDGVIQIYDQFNELAHGSGRASREPAPAKPGAAERGERGGRGGRRSAGGRGAGGRNAAESPRAPAAPRLPRVDAPRPDAAERDATLPLALTAADPLPGQLAVPALDVPVAASDVDGGAEVAATPAPQPMPESAPLPTAKSGRKTAAKGKARTAAAEPAPAEATAPATAKAARAAKAAPRPKAAPAPAPQGAAELDPQVAAAREINAVLALLPKLVDGQWHDLGAAAKVLKEAGLLAKSAPATKLFRKHPHAFQLQPEKQPNQVRFAT